MTSQTLTPERAHALLDILSHHEAYQELRDFRIPGATHHFGSPFKTADNPIEAPLAHDLFTKLIAPLPGLRDVSPDFYQAKCQEIIEDFAKADLSESYEAGYIGIRKTIATATAAVIEAPARGIYGGFAKRKLSREDGVYDISKPADVSAAFDDFIQKSIYANMIDEVFSKAGETDNLSEHDPIVQAAHEHILRLIASFIHYILFISPDGATMLTMLKLANRLVPYPVIRQTLKIGNAATMINGMMKIFLTKMTINSVTTFLGLTNASDAGWNLLQTIISTVVNWDTGTLKMRTVEIGKSKDGPSKAQRDTLSAYVDMQREEHEKCRMMSAAKEEPIVVTIMEEYDGEELSEEQLPLTLEYLSLLVSIRDRKQITDILCSRTPDLLTHAIQEGVAAFDPVIRALHKAVDLSGTVGDVQAFLDDLIRFAPGSKSGSAPTSGDIVGLLKKHQGSCHKFLHQVAKNGPELSNWYREYAKAAIAHFHVEDGETASALNGAGKLTEKLESALTQLSEKQQTEVLAEVDSHITYLSRFSVIPSAFDPIPPPSRASTFPSSKISTPGSSRPSSRAPTRESSVEPHARRTTGQTTGQAQVKFLARWQSYINETVITASHFSGPVRHGGDADVASVGRGGAAKPDAKMSPEEIIASKSQSPTCTRTVELLGGRFKEIIRGCVTR